jgi:PAS domain S-box-containing protein
MTTLSVANRLRLGLALMLALLLAGYVLALRHSPPDASNLTRLLAQMNEQRAAVAAMQARAQESWAAVNAFLRDRDSRQVQALEQADAGFQDTLQRYSEAAGSEEQRSLAREIGEQHARYSAQASALLRVEPAPDNVGPYYDYQQRMLRALLADMPPVGAGRVTARYERKREAAQGLRDALTERAELFSRPAEERASVPAAADLLNAIARYQAFTDTSAERAWAERAARAMRDGDRQASAMDANRGPQREAVDEARASHAALLSLLAKPGAGAGSADLPRAVEQASQVARQAHARLTDMLLVLLGIGFFVALATLHAVRAPLRRLAASTRGYVGDLSFLSLAAPGDEVAELNWALSRLTERAQAVEAHEPTAASAPAEEQRVRQAALAFERSSQAMLLTDEQLNIVLANAAFTDLAGYLPDEVKGATPSMLWSPDHHDAAAIAAVWAAVDEHDKWQGEVMVRTKTADLRPAFVAITAVRDAGGALQHALLVLADRAAMRIADDERHVRSPSTRVERDPVSAGTRARVAETIAGLPVQAGGCAILRMHVPALRSVSEALGDEEAQHLLAEIRARVTRAVGERGAVLDNEGFEPLVLVERAQDTEKLARIAHDVVVNLSAPARFNGLELPIAASVGIAWMPADGDSADALIDAAGTAMERVRAGGGAAFAFTSEPLTTKMRECMSLQDELLAPALTEQLVLHYQPLLALRSGKAIGVEALLRWRHPARGLLTPDAFLAEAQRVGVLPDIGAWVLRSACTQAKRWIESGLPALRVAVNLSRAELESPGLAERVRQALEESGLDARLLQLEVSADTLDAVPDLSPVLAALQGLGVALTLASERDSEAATRALTWLPFTRIKLRAPLRPHSEAAVPGILALARSLNVCVIAEAVETEAQAGALRTQGVDELQGFLLGRPAAARELEMRMRHVSGKAAAAPVPADAS